MTQYNSLNVKLSDSQLHKLKSAIKNESEVVLRLSSNMIGNDETNFPHKLLLTNRQVCIQQHHALHTTTLIISNDEIEEIIKIVKSLEDSSLLLKGVSKTVQNELKEQKGGFLSMLLGTLGAILLGNILAGKGINKAGEEAMAKRQGGGVIRAGYGNKNKMDF